MKKNLLAALQLLVMAEVGWSSKSIWSWEEFTKRLDHHYDVLYLVDIQYFTEE